MPVPSTLHDLYHWIRADGEGSVANRLSGEGLVGATMDLCREGLRVRAIAPEPFRLRLEADGQGFCVHYIPRHVANAHVECPERDDCVLRGPLAKILYVISGSMFDGWRYRANILTWWKRGVIVADGELMLLQRTQGYFGA